MKLELLAENNDWISRDGYKEYMRQVAFNKFKGYKRPKYKVTDLVKFTNHYPAMKNAVITTSFKKSFDSKGYVHVFDFASPSDDIVNYI